MQESDFSRSALVALAEENGVPIGGDAADTLCEFARAVLRENEKYNLTAITETRDFMLLHLIDSLAIVPYLPAGARILDLGCGAGFPSIPIAALRPDIAVFALDATAKKASFVNDAALALGLSNVSAVSGRAEELARLREYRESFDIVTARAVSRLRILCELAAGFIRVGGSLLAMKGPAAQTESEAAECGALPAALGFDRVAITAFELRDPVGGKTVSRSIAEMKKTSATPAAYPRRYAQIVKSGLRQDR